MANLKALAKDTAIYGLSSIVGRFLNYLLVPLYTVTIPSASGGYGEITNVYAFTGLILVILTFGMETTFFRFANDAKEKANTVFSTALTVVCALIAVFLAFIFGFLPGISESLHYQNHPEWVWMMSVVVSLDAFQAIFFSLLRFQKRPIKFAALKLLFIFINIILNLIWFALLPTLYDKYTEPGTVYDIVHKLYSPDDIQGYAFSINLFCTSVITFFFIPEMKEMFSQWHFDRKLLRRMFNYSWPILVLGIAGILNQTVDKMIFPFVYPDAEEGKVQLGIYGACVKVAMIMAMITQAFRYAYEPLVFAKSKDSDAKEMYAESMKYFLIFTFLAFLMVIGYMDILKLIIGKSYREAIGTIPIVMAAEIMMGVYFNLSFWYKLIDKTIWGAWFSLAGCVVLIAVNIIFIPKIGYWACAWGGFAGYLTSMVLSYFVGQKKNPIDYPLKDIGAYLLLTGVLFAVMEMLPAEWPAIARIGINTVLIGIFLAYIVKKDLPLKSLPYVGKYFK
ncbi:MAG: polysaccharide biosynthesis protein [Bacteroidaceae bacterium]|nr:polysaccharide biosynthesis protein [Bacteroidaceae bacterium]